MQNFLKSLCCALFALLVAGCAERRVIPDDELAMIFRDAFLSNAYSDVKGLRLDSLRLYEPIFKKYGYTADDVKYTIDNFSRRKSARLSDVVDRSVVLLHEQGDVWSKEVAILDTVESVAQRRFRHVVLSRDSINIRQLSDTVRSVVKVPIKGAGAFTVAFDYYIDSLDYTVMPRGSVWIEDSIGNRSENQTFYLKRNEQSSIERTVTAKKGDKRLLVETYRHTVDRRPSVRISDFKVYFTPPAHLLLDSLFEEQFPFKIFSDGFDSVLSSHSGTSAAQ